MRVVGIDPGLDGGITHMSDASSSPFVVSTQPMPTIGGAKGKRMISLAGVRNFLLLAKPDLVVIERVGARPGQGVTSCFNFGHGLGVIEGIIFALDLPVMFVIPQVWQKSVLKGLPKDMDKPSQLFCQRTFPNVDWRASDRCRVLHDGMTDSCALAYYGLTQHSQA